MKSLKPQSQLLLFSVFSLSTADQRNDTVVSNVLSSEPKNIVLLTDRLRKHWSKQKEPIYACGLYNSRDRDENVAPFLLAAAAAQRLTVTYRSSLWLLTTAS